VKVLEIDQDNLRMKFTDAVARLVNISSDFLLMVLAMIVVVLDLAIAVSKLHLDSEFIRCNYRTI